MGKANQSGMEVIRHRHQAYVRFLVVAAGAVAALCSVGSLAANPPAAAAPTHPCAGTATEQAKKLLEFHFGPDSRSETSKTVKLLSPRVNPANKKQLFDVLEVWGYIYKGQYRMRFIYARLPGECVLMGQEILEYASL